MTYAFKGIERSIKIRSTRGCTDGSIFGCLKTEDHVRSLITLATARIDRLINTRLTPCDLTDVVHQRIGTGITRRGRLAEIIQTNIFAVTIGVVTTVDATIKYAKIARAAVSVFSTLFTAVIHTEGVFTLLVGIACNAAII